MMNNTDKLLRAFIEASGYEIEEDVSKCTSLESNERNFLGDYIKTDYKVTKKKSIFMGNWEGTDIFVTTEQEGELREMLLYMGELNK